MKKDKYEVVYGIGKVTIKGTVNWYFSFFGARITLLTLFCKLGEIKYCSLSNEYSFFPNNNFRFKTMSSKFIMVIHKELKNMNMRFK
jgi:hypothetical protein